MNQDDNDGPGEVGMGRQLAVGWSGVVLPGEDGEYTVNANRAHLENARTPILLVAVAALVYGVALGSLLGGFVVRDVLAAQGTTPDRLEAAYNLQDKLVNFHLVHIALILVLTYATLCIGVWAIARKGFSLWCRVVSPRSGDIGYPPTKKATRAGRAINGLMIAACCVAAGTAAGYGRSLILLTGYFTWIINYRENRSLNSLRIYAWVIPSLAPYLWYATMAMVASAVIGVFVLLLLTRHIGNKGRINTEAPK